MRLGNNPNVRFLKTEPLPKTIRARGYEIFPADPAVGILYTQKKRSPDFISGHVRMRGVGEGRYPIHYLEMIDNLFGVEKDTVEVCSGDVERRTPEKMDNPFTVDINPAKQPNLVADAQDIEPIVDATFSRWRCDPPYREDTAKKMYGTSLPNPAKLLTAGARALKKDSLMFLLLGPTNYQHAPKGVERIGLIFITIVPNNEIRCLNIYHKFE